MTSTPAAGHTRPLRHMTPRSRDEPNRAATPLELFFDLCFVVAVAQAGLQLVHALAEGHPGTGVVGYLYVFFGAWWAWMNFTWFASAYDCDDVPYRIATFVQISGVLVYAAGVPRAFNDNDWTIAVIGYLIMRVALTTQWLRAAFAETGPGRRTALEYAAGLVICQAGWVGLLFVPDGAKRWLFLVLAAAELLIPLVAERNQQTPWHAHHIVERYGLFTLIVLGETMAASTVAVQSALDENEALGELLPIAAGGLLIVFAAWWIYFAVPAHERLISNRQAIPWGYGHILIFGSAAAIGAGIEVAVEHAVGEAHISAFAANASVTVPASLFLLTVWLLHARHFKRGRAQQLTLPVSALAILACTFAGGWAVLAAGLVAAATVAVGVTLANRPTAPA
ncbi:low temperature requirement protein A [Streptomyces lunaelactis]|uniref:low temperature requirement protein A n=1 Tax=Streptomyces lunaelactis TaxID=1535768 RepID=UPI0015851934|nr:low temperature requirement protein A [Streptomyces lunaelactis]NUK07427.1 low temperature requirement protein A [Streptomyces lunaelactis]NUK42613.1 low temperature requirement protein A [Streptomyces lunaelactis]NUK65789.1 low temperature requirement protein A [Streptomyces lunaelactis]NUK93049.1 low temperature requirement protein A [Streptomyces lunaelactis]NUL09873.1 low temperature requirement protein A [Streptomyces lunaelactis]